MTSTTAILALIAAVLGIIATGAGLWASLRRQARSLAAVVDAVLGHEEARDRSGAVFQQAQPGLAARLAAVDAKVDQIIALDRRVTNLEDSYRAIAAAQRNLGDQPDL